MGNNASIDPRYSTEQAQRNSRSTSGVLKLDSTIQEVAEFLQQASSEENISGISPGAITKYVCNDNTSLGKCIFKQFCFLSAQDQDLPPKILEQLTINQYVMGTNMFIGLITDAEQIKFFAKGFASDERIQRHEVMELIKTAYQMAHLHHPDMCDKAASAVVDAVMHSKESVCVGYFTKWCLQHCHRLVYWMHRHVSQTLLLNRNKTPNIASALQTESSNPAKTEDKQLIVTDNKPAAINKEKSDEAKETKESGFKSSFKKRSPKLMMKSKKSPSVMKKFSPENYTQTSLKEAKATTAAVPKRRRSVFQFRGPSEQVQDVPAFTPPVRSLSTSNLALLSQSCALYAEEQSSPEKCDAAAVDTPILDGLVQSLLNPSLMWLLTCSLPLLFTKNLPKESSVVQARQRKVSLPTMDLVHGILQKQESIHWEPLYISDRDGIGSNRFEHHALNYKGPSLMIVQAQDADVAFCLALDEEWKDSKNFWGGENCVLLQIRPLYRIVDKGEKMMYFNINWRGFPTGIQVGKDYESRSLTINSDFSMLHHHNVPYRIGAIEVWGCGAKDVKEKQEEYKKVRVKDVEHRRKVKITSSDWLEHPDRYLLEMAGGRTSYVHQV